MIFWTCGQCKEGNAASLTSCGTCGKPRLEKSNTLIKPANEGVRDRMNKTEAHFARSHLEPQKAAGDIVRWKFQGIRLAWGTDPNTGRSMHYKPDFVVWRANSKLPKGDIPWAMLVIEVKGPHIFSRDLVRFRGCRAEWPEIAFELWQKSSEGVWSRIE